MTPLRALAVAGLLALAVPSVRAAPPDCFELEPEQQYASKIADLLQTNKGAACLTSHPIAARMAEIAAQASGDWRARVDAAVEVGLAELGEEVDLRNYAVIRDRALAPDRFASANTWQQGAVAESAFQEFAQDCGARSSADDQCRARAASTWAAMAFVHGMQALFVEGTVTDREEYIARGDKRLARWDRYLDAQSFQYPWELTANYCLHTDAVEGILAHTGCLIPGLNGVIARDAMEDEPPTGWPDVPTSRLILLHPEIGITYSDDAPDGQQVEPSLVFEWVGLMGWSWNDDWASPDDDVFDCPLDLCPVGIALTSVYADMAAVDDVGHGLTLHFRNFALSATRHDESAGDGDVWMFTLSTNLSRLIGGNGGDVRRTFKDLVTREE